MEETGLLLDRCALLTEQTVSDTERYSLEGRNVSIVTSIELTRILRIGDPKEDSRRPR